MKKLYFIRHGESEMNVAGHFAGVTDTPLTAHGREQARRAGKKARDLHLDYIISSPLSRAHETAQIIAEEIGYPVDEVHVNKLFIERDFGELEGKPWAPDLNLDGISDIETRDTILERAKLALQFLQELEGVHNILVVSHGSFGRAMRSLILPEYQYVNRSAPADGKHGAIPNAELVNWL